ncbi:MAG: TlpA family protein disulfide reductase [Bacteroidetes bacterium]|nr:TlpA family protein disulfide reductase [Bacteroidota bacterium]
MQRIICLLFIVVTLGACVSNNNKSFTIRGEIKNAPATPVYLELVAFNNTPPQVIDSVTMKDGTFSFKGKTPEESLLQIRFPAFQEVPLLLVVNDKNNIALSGQWGVTSSYRYEGSPASERLRNFIDSLTVIQFQLMTDTATSGLSDSLLALKEMERVQRIKSFKDYTIKTTQTDVSPVVSLFAASMSMGDNPAGNEILLNGLQKRFPKHAGVAMVVGAYREAVKEEPQQAQEKPVVAGKPAPDFTLPDKDGKSISLSSLRGKYVLIDFWASWCGPCRAENPNVVAAYQRYKNKNFTVLGVSLDKNKADWLKAVSEDKLEWQQVSDLKFWETPLVKLYGFEGIPYNVLIDPKGIVIADNLRGEELIKKLGEVLKK